MKKREPVSHIMTTDVYTLNENDKLQVIDHPIDTGKLITNFSNATFYLEKMETYSIFYKEKDYQYFIFKRESPIERAIHLNKWKIFMDRMKFRLPHRL